ncbi:hypothetical protein [Pseudomonas syringae]|uniref:hypothetical protein n=1 Tax=Pseudomonas syringae TaxID=317 RepID=UPI003F87BFBE
MQHSKHTSTKNKNISRIQRHRYDTSALLIKITDQATLDLATKKLKKEEVKLKQLDDISEKQASLKIQGLDCKQELSDLYIQLIKTYHDYAEETSKPAYQFEDDIAVSAEVLLNEDKFNEFSRYLTDAAT